ncbi:MAG: SUMF1/EgtB/PvdO family nonheme iron enzyme, partial [Burkholderiaceae bacterium]
NVWGIWMGITPRDAEATRRMATLSRGVSVFLSSPDWEPYAPTLQWGVFASRWPLQGETVWTLVNRNEYDTAGRQMKVAAEPGLRYFDLAHGVELQAQDGVLSFAIEGRGFGAILATRGEPDAKLQALMAQMRQIGAQPLAGLSAEWKPLPQRIVPTRPTAPRATAPEGMVEIPAGEFLFKVRSLVIEGGNSAGVDVAYPWEAGGVARRFHEQPLPMKRFFIDRSPVSNAQFKAFLDASGYRPADAQNFLKDWTQRDGRPWHYPEGWADKPVTWVALEDARAYAAWAGKRLPQEWEWQYAAQGTDGRAYPWGNSWRDDAVPAPEKGRRHPAPADNDAYPLGASPFGVLDLVGHVWQWTSEFEDDHTRAAILRGGSRYQPQDSIWYFPQAYRNDQHGKYLLMAPAKDRSAMIGFRCVVDAQ